MIDINLLKECLNIKVSFPERIHNLSKIGIELKIDYQSFLREIIAAGTVSYTVYLDGKQVVYVGRKDESHAENFHF